MDPNGGEAEAEAKRAAMESVELHRKRNFEMAQQLTPLLEHQKRRAEKEEEEKKKDEEERKKQEQKELEEEEAPKAEKRQRTVEKSVWTDLAQTAIFERGLGYKTGVMVAGMAAGALGGALKTAADNLMDKFSGKNEEEEVDKGNKERQE